MANFDKGPDWAVKGDFVTVRVKGQLFGIPVLAVRDVLVPRGITRVPLAPAEVAGLLNLRGRVVTAIDLRSRLGVAADTEAGMSVVAEHGGDLYALLVDGVGEVVTMDGTKFESNPPTLAPAWQEFSTGIHRLDGDLMVVLNIQRLLDITA